MASDTKTILKLLIHIRNFILISFTLVITLEGLYLLRISWS